MSNKINQQTNNPTPSILLGFDFGMKRIGVAIGQTITKTARPLETIHAQEGAPSWDKITRLMEKWRPQSIIVGIPLNMDGSEQPLTKQARQFCEKLRERYHIPVHEIDERLTTKDARERLFRQGGYKALQDGQVDRVAAQLILQNWFAEHSNNV